MSANDLNAKAEKRNTKYEKIYTVLAEEQIISTNKSVQKPLALDIIMKKGCNVRL